MVASFNVPSQERSCDGQSQLLPDRYLIPIYIVIDNWNSWYHVVFSTKFFIKVTCSKITLPLRLDSSFDSTWLLTYLGGANRVRKNSRSIFAKGMCSIFVMRTLYLCLLFSHCFIFVLPHLQSHQIRGA